MHANSFRVLYADPTATVAVYDARLIRALADCDIDLRLWLGRAKFEPSLLRDLESRSLAGLAPPPTSGTRLVLPLRRLQKHLLNWRTVLRTAGSGAFDVVHFQWLPVMDPVPVDLLFLHRLRRSGVPVVYTAHNLLPHRTGRFSRAVYRALYSRVDRIIVHTEVARRRLRDEFGVPSHRVAVIPHGLLDQEVPLGDGRQARDDLGLPATAKVIMVFGNLAEYKGVDLAVEGYADLLRSGDSESHLVLAGRIGNGYRDRILDLIETNGIPADRITLKFGWIPSGKKNRYLSAADLMLFPYRAITQSGALLSAIGSGTPFLASDLPGFSETVEPYADRLIVPDPTPHHWARSIQGALENLDGLRSIVASLRREIQREANWSVIADRTLQAYRTVA